MDIYQEFHTLYLPDLFNYVIAVAEPKDRDIEVGSGVLVNVGGRHFVATAQHCINGKPQAMRSATLLQRHGVTDTRSLRILQSAWHDDLDIGFLEIEDTRCPELQWNQLSNDRIVEGMVHVVGYPTVLTQVTMPKPGVQGEISLCAGAFGTTLMEETPDRMTFHYPEVGSKYNEVTGEWFRAASEDPHGFIGGAASASPRRTAAPTTVGYKLLDPVCLNSLDRVFVVPIKRWCELLVERGWWNGAREAATGIAWPGDSGRTSAAATWPKGSGCFCSRASQRSQTYPD